ncbi:type II secretion system F family protein [Aquincola sp. S2]|uniref:Type II secretion system F family protein n=1 Tax=Pseudaquabacterium terrae TaxID=2732868 RepID=A0ABX2EIN7_9BURK|nr:type II secretion system F family protein [Aquabacterium terrae]NRF68452.1 type II secretion system F family protein [Aquabacterium terrae]
MRIEIERRFARLQFGGQVRVRLYRKIATMLANGMSLLRILEELHRRASDDGRKPGDSMAIVLDDWRRSVQNGRMLSEAMHDWVPPSEAMIVMAGEQSGRLEKALSAVVSVVDASSRIRTAIVGGLVYPAVVLVLVMVYLYLFGTRVIPEFARIADPRTWRGAAYSLHVMSEIVQTWMPWIALGLVATVVGVLIAMPRWNGRVREVFDRVPPFSIYRLVVGSGFLMAFSALQDAGMTVEKCLVRLNAMADPWLRQRLEGALLGVKSGLNCGEALRNAGYGFPSEEIVDDLCIYAELRGFSAALQLLADEWMARGVVTISTQMRVLNGFSIATLAIVIGWLVSGFFGIQQEIAASTRAIR